MKAKYKYQPDYAVHPGETLREKLEEIGMTPKEFAIRTGKPVKTISEVLNGKSSITSDMAVQFEKVLGIPAGFWIKKQANFSEYASREKQKDEIKQAREWAKQFPYAHMAKSGLVKPTRKIAEKTEELLKFFRIAKYTAWEDIYLNQQIPIYFRISLKHNKNPYALSVLLQMGKLKARQLDAPPFDKAKLKKIIPELKHVMAQSPRDFLQQIQNLCLSAGVKVVYTPNLPQTVTNGIVRWIDNNPVIQMTDRHKKYDIFWFSFFHELGHILLHGKKKNIFIEESSAIEPSQKEMEADKFASDIVLTGEQYEEAKFIMEFEKDLQNIADYFAKKFHTHRDIIIGRFLKEHKDDSRYKYLYSKILKVDFNELLNS